MSGAEAVESRSPLRRHGPRVHEAGRHSGLAKNGEIAISDLKEVIPMEPYDAEFRGEVLAACDTNEERRVDRAAFQGFGILVAAHPAATSRDRPSRAKKGGSASAQVACLGRLA